MADEGLVAAGWTAPEPTIITLDLSRLDPAEPDPLSTRTQTLAEFGDLGTWRLTMPRSEWIMAGRPSSIEIEISTEGVIRGTVRT